MKRAFATRSPGSATLWGRHQVPKLEIGAAEGLLEPRSRGAFQRRMFDSVAGHVASGERSS